MANRKHLGGLPVSQLMRFVGIAMLLAALTGCGLPRGAALQSEVLKGSKDQDADFAVVPVTRANMAMLQSWQQTGGGIGPWLAASGSKGQLVIKPGDSIDMVIWDSQQNSLLAADEQRKVDIKGLKVTSDGMIFIPYLDQILIAGMSAEAARSMVQTKLEPIVPSAQVQLALQPGSNNIVDLVSGVAKPGRYPVQDRSFSMLSLLSEAGGVTQGLRNPIVKLQREGSSYTIAVSDLFDSARNNTVLRGGDRVIVEADDRYFLSLGATGKEELVYFPKNQVTALDALSLIGGVNDGRADLKGVLVLREYKDKALRFDSTGPSKRQTVFTFDLTSVDGLFAARNFQINPQDVVLATESPVAATQTIFGLLTGTLNIANRASSF